MRTVWQFIKDEFLGLGPKRPPLLHPDKYAAGGYPMSIGGKIQKAEASS
jgi:hypothetical protein